MEGFHSLKKLQNGMRCFAVALRIMDVCVALEGASPPGQVRRLERVLLWRLVQL